MEQDELFVDPRIRSAFLKIPRGHFVPAQHAHEAHIDRPIHLTPFDFNIRYGLSLGSISYFGCVTCLNEFTEPKN